RLSNSVNVMLMSVPNVDRCGSRVVASAPCSTIRSRVAATVGWAAGAAWATVAGEAFRFVAGAGAVVGAAATVGRAEPAGAAVGKAVGTSVGAFLADGAGAAPHAASRLDTTDAPPAVTTHSTCRLLSLCANWPPRNVGQRSSSPAPLAARNRAVPPGRTVTTAIIQRRGARREMFLKFTA